MFAGTYEHNVDAKERLAIPARFRSEFGDGIYLCKGVDKCITVYTVGGWKDYSTQILNLPSNHENSRRLMRAIFGSAFPSELDAQGRVVLPGPLRQYAGINGSVVIMGVGANLEIWAKDLWDTENAVIEKELPKIAEGVQLSR